MIEGGQKGSFQGRAFDLGFIVICDKCFSGKDGFATFAEASEWRKKQGWAVYRGKRDGKWKILCPKCRRF